MILMQNAIKSSWIQLPGHISSLHEMNLNIMCRLNEIYVISVFRVKFILSTFQNSTLFPICPLISYHLKKSGAEYVK